MNDAQFEVCYTEAIAITDKDAYVSDMALSSIWNDAEDADIPNERLEELGRIWDVAHMSMRDIRKNSGITQAAFAQKFLIPRRTVENWDRGVNTPPEYVKILIAKSMSLC